MPQIGFTSKQSPVYTRFNALRRAYEDANGGARIYNPDFLTVLMDGFEALDVIYDEIWRRFHDNEEEALEAMSEDLKPKMKVIKKILAK